MKTKRTYSQVITHNYKRNANVIGEHIYKTCKKKRKLYINKKLIEKKKLSKLREELMNAAPTWTYDFIKDNKEIMDSDKEWKYTFRKDDTDYNTSKSVHYLEFIPNEDKVDAFFITEDNKCHFLKDVIITDCNIRNKDIIYDSDKINNCIEFYVQPYNYSDEIKMKAFDMLEKMEKYIGDVNNDVL